MKRRYFTSQFSFALLAGVLAAANAFAQGLPPSILTGTQAPIKLNSTQVRPPSLVLMGASAKVIAKTANASLGKGWRDKEMVSNRFTNFAI